METLYGQTEATGGGIAMFLPMVLIFAVFYFLIFRPQSQQRKNHLKLLENLKKGDKIITRGGIYGKIVDFQGKSKNKILIDTGEKMKLTVSRAYIAGLSDSSIAQEPDNN